MDYLTGDRSEINEKQSRNEVKIPEYERVPALAVQGPAFAGPTSRSVGCLTSSAFERTGESASRS